MTARVTAGVAERDQHLVQDDVVQDLVAAVAEPVARIGCAWPQVRSTRSARPSRPSERSDGPELDAARPARHLRREVRTARASLAGHEIRRQTIAIAARSAVGVADERDAAVVADVGPLVRRRSPTSPRRSKPSARCAERGRRRGPEAERAVDVHPRAGVARPPQISRRRIERAGVHVAGLDADDGAGVESAAARRRASGPARRPGTLRTRRGRARGAPSAFSTETCTSPPDHDGQRRRARAVRRARRPSRRAPARAWRAAASAVKLAIVAPVTSAPPQPAGQPEQVAHPLERDVLERRRGGRHHAQRDVLVPGARQPARRHGRRAGRRR